MKKLLAVLAIATLSLSFVACDSDTGTSDAGADAGTVADSGM